MHILTHIIDIIYRDDRIKTKSKAKPPLTESPNAYIKLEPASSPCPSPSASLSSPHTCHHTIHMGFKSLTLQMIPLCFHVSFRPENHLGSHPSPQPAVIRLILPDGRVRVYRRAVTADELMAANPCHLVCRSDSFIIGQKVPPLNAGEYLLPGQSYFLLPSNFFSSILSFVSLAASFSSTTSTFSASKLLLLRPFEVQKTAAGRIQLRVSDDFVGRLTEEEEEGEGRKKEGMVCTTEELARVYRELVMSVRVWKPKLEAISESEKKRRSGVGVGFAGMRRRKKKSHRKEQKP